MKIQVVPMPTNTTAGLDLAAEFVMIKVSGAFDPNDAAFKSARELVLKSGSAAMIKSFDQALKNGSFFGKVRA